MDNSSSVKFPPPVQSALQTRVCSRPVEEKVGVVQFFESRPESAHQGFGRDRIKPTVSVIITSLPWKSEFSG
jgi:hypothetical protein